jgi:hypothetical protein
MLSSALKRKRHPVGGQIRRGPVLRSKERWGVGKGNRQRRQQKVAGQQRRQAASPATGSAASSAAAPGAGPTAGRDRSDREQAVVAVADAVSAVGGGRGDDYARSLTQLASERTPQWTSDVSRYLAEVLRMAVARAWRAGWQPAELPRHIGRELTADHAALASDVIAREMRGYPAASIDRRWAAQVATVCPEPVDAVDGDYLGAWLQRSNAVGGLRDVIATAVEILHLLQRLPVLEQLLPLPGTAQPAAARHPAPGAPGRPIGPGKSAGPGKPAGALVPADERMLGRIRALLAKAEATEFAEEAEALSARAQELMARYSIDQALLAAGSGGEDAPAGRRIPVDGPYEDPKTSLLQAVAVANRCRVVWSKEIGLATVIGFPTDLDSVELLFTSLLVQANAALLRAGSRQDARGRSRTKAFRQSFLVSYSVRIGERLAEAAEHATQEAVAEQERAAREQGAAPAAGKTAAGSTGTALVPFLAVRRQAVDDAVAEMFGGSLRRGRGVRVTDEEGWLYGRAAADLASLHGHTPIR